MLNSLFLITDDHEIFIEKHWQTPIDRSICDYLFDTIKQQNGDLESSSPVVRTPRHLLIHIRRDGVRYVGVLAEEIAPLFVLELLHRLVDTFLLYFGDSRESTLKEHFVVVYELLDEMIDAGRVFCVEPNILEEIVKPPSLLRKLALSVAGGAVQAVVATSASSSTALTSNATTQFLSNIGDQLPAAQLSNIPWRRAHARYANNEVYFDVVEQLDAIIDSTGSVLSAEVFGSIEVLCHLSAMPELVMSFQSSQLIDDASLHPCVRLRRWEQDRIVSFVPPDGAFRLLSYRSVGSVAIPLDVRRRVVFSPTSSNTARFELTLAFGRTGRQAEMSDVELELTQFPSAMTQCVATSAQGCATWSAKKRRLTWKLGKLELRKLPTLRAALTFHTGDDSASASDSANKMAQVRRNFRPVVRAHFRVESLSMSGVKVGKVDVFGVKYRPFKGVKYVAKSGYVEMR